MSVRRSGERRQDGDASEVGRTRWAGLETIDPTQKEILDRRPPLTVRGIDLHQEVEHAEPILVVKAEAAEEDGLHDDEPSPEPRQMGSTSDQCRATNRASLEEQKAKLLRREDWVGTNITAPLKIRYPVFTDRCNIGKRRKLDDGYVPQFSAGPVRQTRDSARLHRSVAYGLSSNREPRTEDPLIQIGGRALGAGKRQRSLGLESTGRQAPTSDPVRRSASESTMLTMIEAAPHGSGAMRQQMNLGLQDAPERARPSNCVQSLVSGSSIQTMVGVEPEHGAEWRARNTVFGTQLTPSRRRHPLSEIGTNKSRVDRLSHPLSTLSITSNRDNDGSHISPTVGKPKQKDPTVSSRRLNSEPHLIDDLYYQGDNNSDPPTPIGTEILYTPGLPQGVFELSPSPSLGPAGRLTKEPARDNPEVPRSTAASMGAKSESALMISTSGEIKWKDWISTGSSGNIFKELASAERSRSEKEPLNSSSRQRKGSHNQEDIIRDKSFQTIMTGSSGPRPSRSESSRPLAHPTDVASFGSPEHHGEDEGHGTTSAKETVRNADESWMNFVFSDAPDDDYEER